MTRLDTTSVVTPSERHFVRNNGQVPQRALNQDPRGCTLTIDGEVQRPLKLTLEDLQRMPAVSMPLLTECAGNGRRFFQPETRGTPWRYGAAGCSEWTGVRLRDVLKQAGLKDSAVHTGHYGEDPPLSGGSEVPISRGVPIEKAMEEHTITAYRMNGKPRGRPNGWRKARRPSRPTAACVMSWRYRSPSATTARTGNGWSTTW